MWCARNAQDENALSNMLEARFFFQIPIHEQNFIHLETDGPGGKITSNL